MKISANLSLLFHEQPLLKRIEEAASAGFDGVEIQFPYEEPAEALANSLGTSQIPLIMFNAPAGDLMNGGEGLAAVPGKADEFKRGVDQALKYADTLNTKMINVLPGRCLDESQRGRYYDTLLTNLHWCQSQLKCHGITTLVEAINIHNMPGFLINTGDQLNQLMNDLSLDDVKMQYDFYHMARMNQPIEEQITSFANRIGHVQFADCPDRHQPGTGQVDIFGYLEELLTKGYQGWAGAEYIPKGPTHLSLNWLASLKAL